METWIQDNRKARTRITFKNVIPRKIQKELYYKYRHLHIFRIKLKKFKGWAFWADKIVSRDVEYIGEVYNLKYTPSDKTWKEFRKEYEERYY
jgi:hypothetical protein